MEVILFLEVFKPVLVVATVQGVKKRVVVVVVVGVLLLLHLCLVELVLLVKEMLAVKLKALMVLVAVAGNQQQVPMVQGIKAEMEALERLIL
jgi:hypothetical protein